MSMIRKRPDENLAVHGATVPVQAGGYVAGAENTLLEPGTANVSALKVAPTTSQESAIGALRETIAAKALRGIDYMDIPSEADFDPATALGDKVSQYSPEELQFLGDSRSSTELAQRMGQVVTTRGNLADMGAHPAVALAASLLDVDAVIGLGVGKAVGVARSARLLAGLTANAAVLGAASEGGEITPLDVIGTSLGVALGAVPMARRALTAEERATETAARTVEDVPTVTPDVGPSIEVPVRPRTFEKVSAEELAKTDSTVQVTPTKVEPDPDYVPPTPDMTTTVRPYMEVGITKGRATLQTSTANYIGAILANANDMPEGSRLLGAALHDSLKLDGDVPLIVRKDNVRSKVQLMSDGSVNTIIGMASGAKNTLSETVAAQTAYDKTIALHEAAHAKTITATNLFKKGALPDGVVKSAVQRIEDIRTAVKANIDNIDRAGISEFDWKNNVMYGVNDLDEFIAQVFNSPDFRNVLQQTKIPGQTKSVWSELVRSVVQAFTGKGPDDSALTALVDAFEELLNAPGVDAAGWAKASKSMPNVQSDILAGAPDVRDLFQRAGKAVNKSFALYDNIKSIGAKAATLADQLVVDATSSNANSAAHYARTAHLAANTAAAQVDSSIRQALRSDGWGTLSRLRNPTGFRQAQRDLSDRVYAALADNHQRYREGSTIVPHGDPKVEAIVKSFADSKWAEDQLQRIKASGMLGADAIEESPYYLPRRHNANKVNDFLRSNPNVTRKDIVGMYASQFTQMFSAQGIRPDTARALGRQMLRNMEDRASGVSGYRQHIAGMTGDDIEFAMRNAGIEEDQIQRFLQTANHAGEEANTVRNLRGRADFDMTAEYTTASGEIIYPQMFVDKDVLGLMEGYSRTMSGRIGLAKAGFPDVKSLAAAVDEAAAEGVDARAARTTLDNTVNQLLGYPTGEDVPDILRSFAVVSGAVQLANSGIYQLADTALMIKEFGITKVLKGLGSTQWGRDALKLAQDPTYGSRLRDVLEARNVLSGRYRTVMTHLDDNTDIGNLGIAHQLVQQMGQGTRFVNGMEYVRRGQSKLMAGLVGDSVDAAVMGDDAAFATMKRFGMTDDLRARARAAMDADPDLRTWPDDLRLDMETVGHNMADALVQENRLGELPAWMQFSTLGKFILPYMNFVAGTWNKILRRTYTQDGVQGVAMMLAYQLPLTTLSSTVALAQAGKDITPSTLTANVLTQLPLMSWMGYAVNMMTQGPTNSIAALGMVDKAYSATASILSGDPDPAQIIRAVPFISIIPGIRVMANAMGEED
jgi:hypothetical protein